MPQTSDDTGLIEIGCQFCGQSRCKDRMTPEGVAAACAAYLAHLIESHWDKLELGRAYSIAAGGPVDGAWMRI